MRTHRDFTQSVSLLHTSTYNRSASETSTLHRIIYPDTYALHKAILFNHSKCVEHLIRLGVSVHETYNGYQPLLHALECAHIHRYSFGWDTIVRLLLQAGAPTGWILGLYHTHDFAKRYSMDIIRMVSDNCTGENTKDIHTRMFMTACEYGRARVVKFLISRGANVFAFDNWGMQRAVELGHRAVIRELNKHSLVHL